MTQHEDHNSGRKCNQSVEPPPHDESETIIDLSDPTQLQNLDPFMSDMTDFSVADIEQEENTPQSLPKESILNKDILQPIDEIPSLFTDCGQLPSQQETLFDIDMTNSGLFEEDPKSVHFGPTKVKIFDKTDGTDGQEEG